MWIIQQEVAVLSNKPILLVAISESPSSYRPTEGGQRKFGMINPLVVDHLQLAVITLKVIPLVADQLKTKSLISKVWLWCFFGCNVSFGWQHSLEPKHVSTTEKRNHLQRAIWDLAPDLNTFCVLEHAPDLTRAMWFIFRVNQQRMFCPCLYTCENSCVYQ